MNAIINVNKPAGMTSYDVIRNIKRITKEKKIGHIGTLDPFAEGVLPVFLGKMTKVIPFFNGLEKTYRANIRLGAQSTTLDREGTITTVPIPEIPDLEKISAVLQEFEGEIVQIPPMFSAIKVDGKPLYKYARQGVEIERKPRTVYINWIRDVVWNFPFLAFSVNCSKGVYIRTLAEDIGHKLGTNAYLEELTRTAIGNLFPLQTAFSLDQITKLNEIHDIGFLLPPQTLLKHYHRLNVSGDDEIARIKHGSTIVLSADNLLPSEEENDDHVTFAFDQGDNLIAVGNLEFSQDSFLRFSPTKVLI